MADRAFPKLFGYSSKGKTKEWQIIARKVSEEQSLVVKRWGFVSHKIQESSYEVNAGKNVGKANETTPWQQAVLEAQSGWNAKRDDGYVEFDDLISPDRRAAVTKPMKAQTYDIDKPKEIAFPCYGQPKLNGIRCLVKKVSDEQIVYNSKRGKSKDHVLQHLTPYLLDMLEIGEELDGEIYRHGWSLNYINSRASKYYEGETEQLQYWVYDTPKEGMPQCDRWNWLKDRIATLHKHIKLINCFEVTSHEDIVAKLEEWYALGYEGIMLRRIIGDYRCGHRVNDLLKVKKWMDAEFVIVGAKDGKGKDKGCVIWQCATKEGNTFWVKPEGTKEDRQEKYNNQDKYMGCLLTVKFLNYSDYGIPEGNTVGKEIRPDE